MEIYTYKSRLKEILNIYNIKEYEINYIPDTMYDIVLLYTQPDNFNNKRNNWLNKEITNENIKDVHIVDLAYKEMISFDNYEQFKIYINIIRNRVA